VIRASDINLRLSQTAEKQLLMQFAVAFRR
jgi:hypothetical protein